VLGGLVLVAVVVGLSWKLLGDVGEASDAVGHVVAPNPDRMLPTLADESSVPEPAVGMRTRSMFGNRVDSDDPADWMTIWIQIRDEAGRECPGAGLTLPNEVPARIEVVDSTTFKLRALEGSRITVFASSAGFADRWRTLKVTAANDPSQGGKPALFSMRPLQGAWALVVDGRGRPVPGETVEFHWKGRQFRSGRVTHGVVGSDGQVYCAYPPGWLQQAYLGETERGAEPDPDRQLTVVGRAPLTLETPLAPEG
jgi:hypothetical protein